MKAYSAHRIDGGNNEPSGGGTLTLSGREVGRFIYFFNRRIYGDYQMSRFRVFSPLYILIGAILVVLTIFGIIEYKEYEEQKIQEENGIAAGIRRFLEE